MDNNIKRKELLEMLQKAVELEFATIPPYLTAAFSLFPNSNRSSFQIIHSVYMEEMLHLVLAANVLNAIGGTVKLGKDNIPTYPLMLDFKGAKFKNREFYINLERFNKSSIETFLAIELPDGWDEETPVKRGAEIVVPGYTIGEFYESIKTQLIALCDEIGEENVFIGDENRQIGEVYYWSGGGKAFEVRNLKDATEAIDVIVEQGEGSSLDSLADGDKEMFGQMEEVPHYFRFNEIYMERKYKMDDNPRLPPTGEVLPVDWHLVFPTKINCKSTDFEHNWELKTLNTKFNQHFTLMIKGIEAALNGQRETLFSAIMNDMHGMAKIANRMVQIPIHDGEKETGSPSFEIIDLTK